VKVEWLRGFLTKPSAIRPFGAYVGSGSRMPDFHLSEGEVDSLVAYLAAMRANLPRPDSQPKLSVFRAHEVETLLRDRLPCLGCHRLGDDGGRIAPDLTTVGARLQPAYIDSIIRDPEHAVPGTIMPRVPIPPREAARIVAYLVSRGSSRAQRGDSARAGYLSLVDNAPTLPTGGDGAAALYGRICSNCHGKSGGGDGWNAAYLPVRPTVHADATYMSSRSDRTLYDGIATGGYTLDRSNRMPPFGETLSGAQIDSLVHYIRKLCDCEGPAWSRDGAPQ
jgi:mono/diheme cytochrome c family protein